MKQLFLKVIEPTEESKRLGFYQDTYQLNDGVAVNERGEYIGLYFVLYSKCVVQITEL